MAIESDTPNYSVQNLATFIYNMRYEDLRDLGRELHGMTAEDETSWNLKDPAQWSDMIFCWAEANLPLEEAE